MFFFFLPFFGEGNIWTGWEGWKEGEVEPATENLQVYILHLQRILDQMQDARAIKRRAATGNICSTVLCICFLHICQYLCDSIHTGGELIEWLEGSAKCTALHRIAPRFRVPTVMWEVAGVLSTVLSCLGQSYSVAYSDYESGRRSCCIWICRGAGWKYRNRGLYCIFETGVAFDRAHIEREYVTV